MATSSEHPEMLDASQPLPTPDKTIGIADLLRSLLGDSRTVLFRNVHGSVELRGEDLAVREHGDWLTIYHRNAAHRELESHIHLRRASLTFAEVQEPENMTPRLGFWSRASAVDPKLKPPLAVLFPAYVDWHGNRQESPENRAFFRDWVARYGRRFQLKPKSLGSPLTG